jgi:hypothetical protein
MIDLYLNHNWNDIEQEFLIYFEYVIKITSYTLGQLLQTGPCIHTEEQQPAQAGSAVVGSALLKGRKETKKVERSNSLVRGKKERERERERGGGREGVIEKSEGGCQATLNWERKKRSCKKTKVREKLENIKSKEKWKKAKILCLQFSSYQKVKKWIWISNNNNNNKKHKHKMRNQVRWKEVKHRPFLWKADPKKDPKIVQNGSASDVGATLPLACRIS